MEKTLRGACIIGQSGGPTSVINSSAYGVIRTALDSDCITKVYGAAHGIKGVLEDKLYDMGEEDAYELSPVSYTHLDVYKRQGPYWQRYRRSWPSRATATPDATRTA